MTDGEAIFHKDSIVELAFSGTSVSVKSTNPPFALQSGCAAVKEAGYGRARETAVTINCVLSF